MAARNIDEVSDWIRACPRLGEFERRMLLLLEELRDLFEQRRLKYTVSMCNTINVQVDDGRDGFEHGFPEKWFTVGPAHDGYTVRMGSRGDIIRELDVSRSDARSAVKKAIEYVSRASERG